MNDVTLPGLFEQKSVSKSLLLQDAWPFLIKALRDQQLQPSEIVQALIEHRLALPFYAAALTPESKMLADLPLMRLAAQLQEKMQPAADETTLLQALTALHQAGISALVLKGAAYGNAFYLQPSMRRSTDHDILVAPEQRKKAHETLLSIGFRANSAQVFQNICGQASYRKKAPNKAVEIDLHWELGNNFALYQRFDFEALRASAVEVSIAGAQCLRPNDFYCAIHCALNYCSDHPQHRSYLALLDLLLITHGFSGSQQTQLCGLAKSTETLGVLQFAMNQAKALFGEPQVKSTNLPFDALDPLLQSLENRFKGSEFWWPMRTPRPLSAKLRFLLRQALPPSDYMHARYGDTTFLPVLHFKRILIALRSLGQH